MYGAYTDRFLGVETATAESYGPIIVRDGLGNEITVPAGERKAFPVKIDDDGRFFWRGTEQERYEGFPVVESTKLSWLETNYIQVTRDAGRNITWACYKREAAPATPPPSAPAAGAGGAFAAAVGMVAEAAGAGRPPAAGAEGDWTRQSYQAARSLTTNLLQYVEEAPRRLSYMCFIGGAVISLNGLLDVLNIFEVFDSTVYYLVHCYMVFFGLVTCITELHPDATPQWYETLRPFQAWMHKWAKGLTTLWGRGLFHIFQGSLAIVASGSLGFGILIGLYMMVMGVLYVYLHFRAPGTIVPQEEYIRIEN